MVTADDLVGSIYQGPLEDPPWATFLHELRLWTHSDVAAISLRLGRSGARPLVLWDRQQPITPAALSQAADDHARLIDKDPLAKALAKPGDIFTLDEVIDEKELMENDFFKHVIKPHGIEQQLGMFLSEPGGWCSTVGVMNGKAKPPYGSEDKAFFRSFLPHLERALEIYARLQRYETQKSIFEDALDSLTIGAFVLDGLGRLLEHNACAQNLIDEHHYFSIRERRLVLDRREATKRLERAISQALDHRNENPETPFVKALRVESRDGETLGLLVRGVPVRNLYVGEVSPSLIVYVSDPSISRPPRESLVASLFGLTPSEAHLATLLANGLTLQEASVELGLKEGTIRTYTKRLFSKTGVNRQADLVRLILKSVAFLA